MTTRITVSTDAEGRLILVEGHLSIDEVEALEQAVGDEPFRTRLELSELRSADGAGLSLLRRLRLSGVVLHGARPHLAWRIEAGSS